nr:DUF397 domain-containing protein [Streptomyces sp. REN17]
MTWTKSSHSSGEGGDCVEIAVCSCTVRVRDFKNSARPGLAVTQDAWAAFVGYAAERTG